MNYLIDTFNDSERHIKDIYDIYIKDYIKEYIPYGNYLTSIKDVLISSSTFVSIYSKFTLMESLLLLDGVICSIYFLNDFLILKMSYKKITKEMFILYNQEIVEKYNNIYILSIIDRYLFYLCMYLGYNMMSYFCQENKYSYILILLMVFPGVQNRFISLRCVNAQYNKYKENKEIFIKYSISKLAVKVIQNLHPQIEEIANYHIFIIYKILNMEFVWGIVKNCCIICVLNILRSCDATYYYYKAIKMAYYYNVGYLYNVIPLGDTIYTVNIIINEKRWKELLKIEVVNAFFILFVNKYDLFNKLGLSLSINCQIILCQIFSLYSIVSLFKIINNEGYISLLYVCFTLLSFGLYFRKINIKNSITSILVYFLILFNTNDLIITLVIVIQKLVYYWIGEIYFFIINVHNIKKVIKMTPTKEMMLSKIKDEYVVI